MIKLMKLCKIFIFLSCSLLLTLEKLVDLTPGPGICAQHGLAQLCSTKAHLKPSTPLQGFRGVGGTLYRLCQVAACDTHRKRDQEVMQTDQEPCYREAIMTRLKFSKLQGLAKGKKGTKRFKRFVLIK